MLPRLLGAGLKGMGSSVGGAIQNSVSGGAKALGAIALSQTEPEVLATMAGGKALLSKLKRTPTVRSPQLNTSDEVEDFSSPVTDGNLEKAIEDMGKSITGRLSKMEDVLSDDLFSINFTTGIMSTALEEIAGTVSMILGSLPDLESRREKSRRNRETSKFQNKNIKLLTRISSGSGGGDSGGSGLMSMLAPLLIPLIPIVLKIVGIITLAVIGLATQITIAAKLFEKFKKPIMDFINFFKDFPYKKLLDDFLGRNSRIPGRAAPAETVSSFNPDGTRKTERQIDEEQLKANAEKKLNHGIGLVESSLQARRTKNILDNGGTMEDVTTKRIEEMHDRFGVRRKVDPNEEIDQVPLFRKDDPNVLFETPVRLTPKNVKPSDLNPTNTPQRELTPERAKEATDRFQDIIGGDSGFKGGDKVLPTKVSSVTNIFNPVEPRSPFRDFITGYPTGIGFA